MCRIYPASATPASHRTGRRACSNDLRFTSFTAAGRRNLWRPDPWAPTERHTESRRIDARWPARLRRQTNTQFRIAMRAARVNVYEEALRHRGHLRDWATASCRLPGPRHARSCLAEWRSKFGSRAIVTLQRFTDRADVVRIVRFGDAGVLGTCDGDASRWPWPQPYGLEAWRTTVRTRLDELGAVTRADIDLLSDA